MLYIITKLWLGEAPSCRFKWKSSKQFQADIFHDLTMATPWHSSALLIFEVIHQPRYPLFSLFDDVLLLGPGGRTVTWLFVMTWIWVSFVSLFAYLFMIFDVFHMCFTIFCFFPMIVQAMAFPALIFFVHVQWLMIFSLIPFLRRNIRWWSWWWWWWRSWRKREREVSFIAVSP